MEIKIYQLILKLLCIDDIYKESQMRNAALLVVFTALNFAGAAKAQDCEQHPVLDSYKQARDFDLPSLEDLTGIDKEALKAAYTILEDTVVNYASTVTNNPVPPDLLTNYSNFRKIAQGDKLGGGLGIYSNVVGKFSPALGEALPNMWRGSIDGLSGKGNSYPLREDAKNRLQANKSLAASNCKRLTLQPYSNNPPQPDYYVAKNGLCEEINLSSLKGPATVVAGDFKAPNECRYEAAKPHYPDEAGVPADYYVNAVLQTELHTSKEGALDAWKQREGNEVLATSPSPSGSKLKTITINNVTTSIFLHENLIITISTIKTPNPASLVSQHSAFAAKAFNHLRNFQ